MKLDRAFMWVLLAFSVCMCVGALFMTRENEELRRELKSRSDTGLTFEQRVAVTNAVHEALIHLLIQ